MTSFTADYNTDNCRPKLPYLALVKWFPAFSIFRTATIPSDELHVQQYYESETVFDTLFTTLKKSEWNNLN